jgi:hypothetical protein
VLVFVGLCVNLPGSPSATRRSPKCNPAFSWPAPSDLSAGLSAVVQHSVVSSVFWRELVAWLRPLLWPFAVGSTVAAGVLAAGTYRMALGVARVADRRRATER